MLKFLARGGREKNREFSQKIMQKDESILSSKIALALMVGASSMSFAVPAFAATAGPDATAAQSGNTIAVNSAVDYVYGGYDASPAGGAAIGNNHVTINKGATLGTTTAANFNKVAQGYDHQKGDYVAFSATGAYSENNDVEDSSVVMNDGTAKGNVVGAIAYRGNATGNSAEMNGGTVDGQDLVGAAATYEAKNNTVTLNKGEVGQAVIGGQGEQTADGNKVYINGGSAQQAIGGYSYSGLGNMTNNTVVVNGGTVKGDVMGAQTKSGSATGNTVIINGGTLSNSNIIGGAIHTKNRDKIGDNAANNNTVILNTSLKTKGYLYGGYDEANVKIGTSDVITGNKLVVHAKGVDVNNIYNFSDMNVTTDGIKKGDTIVTVNNENNLDTDLTRTNISVSGTTDVKDGLNNGDTFTVISKGDTGTLKTDKTTGTVQKGVSREYDLGFKNDGKSLVATVGNAHLTDQTKVFTGAQISQSELVNLGSDAVDDIASSFSDVTKGDNTPWVHISQNRGHLEGFKGMGTIYNVGFANTKVDGDKVTTVAPFFEYGHGNYEYDPAGEGATAGGSSNLFGVGGFFRTFNQDNGHYFTGAGRVGRVKGDFTGHNMKGASGDVTFDADGTYFAGQLRTGKIHAEGDREFVDEYAGLYFSHTPAESATMNTDEAYDFDAINSLRLRLGVRHNRDTGKGVQYVGAYVQHEFAGDATASFDGMETPGTQLKGTSAVGEVGYRQDVDENHKIGHDVSIKGYGAFGGWSAQRYGVQLQATAMGKF